MSNEAFQMPRDRNERSFESRVDRRYRLGAQTKRYRRFCYDVNEVRTPISSAKFAETEFGNGQASKPRAAPTSEQARWRRKLEDLAKQDPWEIALGKK